MPTFEEFREEFCKHTPNARRDAYSREFYEAGQSAATFAANSKLGDEGNEAEKDARRKVAVDYILHECDSFGPCLKARELDAIIAKAQG